VAEPTEQQDKQQVVQEVARLLHEKKWAEALELSDRAIARFPESHDLWVNKGIALRRLGRLDDALAAYDKANELNPDDADCWLNRGVCIRAMNRPQMHEKAVKSYTRAVEVDPDCADALMNLGNVSSRIAYFYATDAEIKKEHFRRMEEAYQRALAVKPDSWEQYGDGLHKAGALQQGHRAG
jgi:tetratricopeptide (TPR) repeat protein